MHTISKWMQFLGFYSLDFRGDRGSGVRVGMVIVINYGDGLDMPSGNHPPDRLRLTSHGIKVTSSADDHLPLVLCAEILPEGLGGRHLPPILSSLMARYGIPATAEDDFPLVDITIVAE